MAKDKPIRTRIAPSPTGNLHVGTARAALFSELFARQHGGKFIIRLEDTDKARSKREYEEQILEALTWLGIHYDEGPDVGGEYGPYRQSERTSLYREALEKLLAEGKAYMCTCDPKAKQAGDVHACTCSIEEKKIAEGNTVIRLNVEPQDITFHDEVRGDVTVHTDSFGGDFVIARSLDDALFHLAVVVDDELMAISHVIRGEDHLHNTIKHILIQRALGYEQPVYAHLPLLLDEQRKKLSKRKGETNVLAYKEMGYLPEAMLNYLGLLGWGAKDDKEFFTHEDLIQEFSLERVQKGGAIFSIVKLQSINKLHIRTLSAEELLDRAMPFFEKSGVTGDRELLLKAVKTEQERIATLAELPEAVSFFLPTWSADYDPTLLVWRKSTPEVTVTLLEKLRTKLESIPAEDFSLEALQTTLMEWIDREELGRGDTLWPMRVALTGKEHSPGPFEVASILGKEESLTRIKAGHDKLMNL